MFFDLDSRLRSLVSFRLRVFSLLIASVLVGFLSPLCWSFAAVSWSYILLACLLAFVVICRKVTQYNRIVCFFSTPSLVDFSRSVLLGFFSPQCQLIPFGSFVSWFLF